MHPLEPFNEAYTVQFPGSNWGHFCQAWAPQSLQHTLLRLNSNYSDHWELKTQNEDILSWLIGLRREKDSQTISFQWGEADRPKMLNQANLNYVRFISISNAVMCIQFSPDCSSTCLQGWFVLQVYLPDYHTLIHTHTYTDRRQAETREGKWPLQTTNAEGAIAA